MSRFRTLALALACGLALAPAARAEEAAVAFPPGFLWGAATAAHQVEGGLDNDWMPWEALSGSVKNGDSAAIGVDHYRRYDADFALAASMGHNAHRLSIEWSRIEPSRGHIDWAAVDHYHDVLRSLRRHGMAPMVTLHHFTNPRWVAAQGGWLSDRTPEDFARFAGFCGREFGREVDWWMTLNEPNVYAFNAYDKGAWPPSHRDRDEALRVMATLMKGHALGYRALHLADHTDVDSDGVACRVGVANHIALFDPLSPFNPIEVATAHFNTRVFDQAMLLAQTTGRLAFEIPGAHGVHEVFAPGSSAADFIGVNYYTRYMCVAGGPKERIPKPGAPVTALGWEIYPEGIYRALKLADAYAHLPDGRRIPLLITENGIDDPANGAQRDPFLVRHLQEVARAIHDGVDVRGYLHWTLMDNFEWADGYAPRFGLYQVDRRPAGGLARVPTSTVGLFTRITAANGLTQDMIDRFGER